MVEPVRKTIEVPCDPDEAFDIFVNRIGSWWPLGANSVSAMDGKVARDVVLEPKVGGSIHEIVHDGARIDWGRVQGFEPGRALVLTWHVMATPEQATTVEIRFTPNKNGTRVDLTHSGWEVLADEAKARRDSYDNGWVGVFEKAYAGACAAQGAAAR